MARSSTSRPLRSSWRPRNKMVGRPSVGWGSASANIGISMPLNTRS